MNFQISFILLIVLIGCSNGKYLNNKQMKQINSYLEKQTQYVSELANALNTDLTKMPLRLENASLVRDVGYELFNLRAALTSSFGLMYSTISYSNGNPLYSLMTLTREIQDTASAILSKAFSITTILAFSGKKIEDAFPDTLKELNSYKFQMILTQLNPSNLYYSISNLLKDTFNNLKIGSILSDLLRENDLIDSLSEISDLIDKLSRYN